MTELEYGAQRHRIMIVRVSIRRLPWCLHTSEQTEEVRSFVRSARCRGCASGRLVIKAADAEVGGDRIEPVGCIVARSGS